MRMIPAAGSNRQPLTASPPGGIGGSAASRRGPAAKPGVASCRPRMCPQNRQPLRRCARDRSRTPMPRERWQAKRVAGRRVCRRFSCSCLWLFKLHAKAEPPAACDSWNRAQALKIRNANGKIRAQSVVRCYRARRIPGMDRRITPAFQPSRCRFSIPAFYARGICRRFPSAFCGRRH